MLAAEAKKAGIASEDTRLTPRPPSLTGRLACIAYIIIIIINKVLIKVTLNKVIAGALYIVIYVMRYRVEQLV